MTDTDNGQKPMTEDEVVSKIFEVAVECILIGMIMEMEKEEGLAERGKTNKPIANMWSKAMRESELKELKRQNRMIMKRYGRF